MSAPGSPDETGSSALDTPTTMDSIVRKVARVDAAPSLAPGQTLDGTYQLVERIGGGGMGVVYRARDLRLGRDVAVKVVKSGGAADEHLRRLFDREARATAQLLHPNIVTLHHVGEHSGNPYLVLELLVGEPLSARLGRKNRLPVDEALDVLDAVLGAVAFAHERGVLHRDLKPNNVFVTADQRIKVLDFGVALTLDTDPGPVTRSAGTPGYMAPEQRDGGDQDVRTDVWAAALLMLECLLGRRPDEKHAVEAIAQLDAPAAVKRVLERALDPDPSRRPATAAELKVALAEAGGRLGPDPQRRRRAIVRGVVAATLAAAVAAGATLLATRSRALPAVPTAAELTGAWTTGLFGTMLLRIADDGTAYGVYEWDEGVIVGRYADGVLVGTWCEMPSRLGPDDAGQLRLSFVRGTNRLMVDGLWSYGKATATSWLKDWTGSRLDSPAPSELVQRAGRNASCP